MKFSRNDLPFRKAPEKMWLSAISHFVSITFINNIHTGIDEKKKRINKSVFTCDRYDTDGFVSDVVLVQDVVERLLVQEELVCFTLIINLYYLNCSPHDIAGQIVLKKFWVQWKLCCWQRSSVFRPKDLAIMDFEVFKEAIWEAVVQVHMYPIYTFMQSKNNRMLLWKSMLFTSLQT